MEMPRKAATYFSFTRFINPGIATVELFVAFFGRKLEALHKHVAKLLIHILMQDSSPVGYVDICFVEGIQLVDVDDVDLQSESVSTLSTDGC